MGCFSWLFCNSGRPLNADMHAYVYTPDGSVIKESAYDGYGEFGGLDIFDLVADWNREFLSKHPEFMLYQSGSIPQPDGSYRHSVPVRADSHPWYEFYADLTLSKKDIEKHTLKKVNSNRPDDEKRSCFNYRDIGIDIASGIERNAWLPFPIKIASRGDIYCGYARLPASDDDSNQGFGRPRKSENDRDNFLPNILPLPSHVCPECGGTSFYATAHIAQDWEIDGDGEFVSVIEDCSEVDHSPDDNDLWQCTCCGLQKPGEFFTQTDFTKHTKRFELRIYDRNLPYVKSVVGEDSNSGKVVRSIKGDTVEAIEVMWDALSECPAYPGQCYALKDMDTGLILMDGTLPVDANGKEDFLNRLKRLSKTPLDAFTEKGTFYRVYVNGVPRGELYTFRAEAVIAAKREMNLLEEAYAGDDEQESYCVTVEAEEVFLPLAECFLKHITI